MCQIENKTSALTLQSSLLSLMLRHGLKLEQAELAAHDIIDIFARSEVAHPCWAADALGLAKNEEVEEETTTDDPTPKGITAMALGPNGVEIVGGEGLPPEVLAALKNFSEVLTRKRRG